MAAERDFHDEGVRRDFNVIVIRKIYPSATPLVTSGRFCKNSLRDAVMAYFPNIKQIFGEVLREISQAAAAYLPEMTKKLEPHAINCRITISALKIVEYRKKLIIILNDMKIKTERPAAVRVGDARSKNNYFRRIINLHGKDNWLGARKHHTKAKQNHTTGKPKGKPETEKLQ